MKPSNSTQHSDTTVLSHSTRRVARQSEEGTADTHGAALPHDSPDPPRRAVAACCHCATRELPAVQKAVASGHAICRCIQEIVVVVVLNHRRQMSRLRRSTFAQSRWSMAARCTSERSKTVPCKGHSILQGKTIWPTVRCRRRRRARHGTLVRRHPGMRSR